MVDIKGIGKPYTFNNKQDQFLTWVRRTENYIVGVFGEEFRPVLEWAMGCETEISEDDLDLAFGAGADDCDRVDDLHRKVNQVYQALHALTEDESQDIVIGAGSGRGAEAWRKLGWRWDPIVAGRKRTLLKAIIAPERCKLDELIGTWERWEEQVRRYEKRKDDKGQRLHIDQELKMTAFELLLPTDLENHLILNKRRLTTYELQKEEVNGILESKIGAKIREVSIKAGRSEKDPNAMDLDGFTRKGGGKAHTGSSGQRFEGNCRNCGKPGHKAADCWSKASPGNKAGGGGGGSKGGGPKGHGGKDGGKSSGGGAQAKPRFEGNCHKCGKPGHKSADCWSKATSGTKGGGGKPGGKKGGKRGVGSIEEDQGGEPEMEAGSIELGSFGAELDIGRFTGTWQKLNYDTGAAITVFKKSVAPEGVASGNGRSYRTATGELTEDAGAIRMTAEDEDDVKRGVSGRLADVHKTLVSASKSAKLGMNGWISEGGGWLVPEASKASRQIHQMLERMSRTPKHGMIRLYEENGVYNFYLKNEVFAAPKEGPADVKDIKALSREELEAEVKRLRGPGFPGQPQV